MEDNFVLFLALIFVGIFIGLYIVSDLNRSNRLRSIYENYLALIVLFFFFLSVTDNFSILARIYEPIMVFLPLAGAVSVTILLYIFINDILLRNAIEGKKQENLLSNTTIIPYYEPPADIHPAVAGFLIDKKIGKREFYATLFNSIIKGHIVIDERIHGDEFEYYLLKNKGFSDSLSCERLISDFIFQNDGKNIDCVSIKNIRMNSGIIYDFIRDEIIKLKYFENPFMRLAGSLPSSLGLREAERYWINAIEKNYAWPSLFTSKEAKERKRRKADVEIAGIKEYFQNRKARPAKKLRYACDAKNNLYTELGARERAKWLGFKDYLQTAERFRLDAEKIETFSKYLPYAVALGVETQWAKRFENMSIDRLEWFQSHEEGIIKRHDDHGIYFKHLVIFMGSIYTR